MFSKSLTYVIPNYKIYITEGLKAYIALTLRWNIPYSYTNLL